MSSEDIKKSKIPPKDKPAAAGKPKGAGIGTKVSTERKKVKASGVKTKPTPSRLHKTDTFATRDAHARNKARKEAITAASRSGKPSKKNAANSSRPSSSASKSSTGSSKVSKTSNTSKKSPNSSRLSSRRSAGNNPSKHKPMLRKKAPVPIRPTENNGLSRTKSTTSSPSSKSSQKQSESEPELEVPEPKIILTADQSIAKNLKQGRRQSTLLTNSLLGLSTDLTSLLDEIEGLSEDEDDNDNQNSQKERDLDPMFKSCYGPDEMRCLALVAHNHMKPPMRNFVLANKNLLSKFKLTGTNTTMTMLREIYGDNPDVKYGPTCTSGPLGGDAELVAVMCTENLGACVFFQDPMSAHPHISDIECLTRQANVHNIIIMPNPTTAFAVMTTFRVALQEGRAELIPSFFETLMSPSVIEYKKEQNRVLESNVEHLNDYS